MNSDSRLGPDWRAELDARLVSVAELARTAGLPDTTVRRIVRGQFKGRAATRRRLAEALRGFPVQVVGT